MARRKTWSEKFHGAPAAHVTVLDKPFAGVPAGRRLFIATPALVEQQVLAVPRGRTLDVKVLRERLAREARADAACPLTTSIFLRIVAERALEAIAAGTKPADVAPFWRAIDPDSSLAAKLTCGADFIRQQRALEAV